MQRLGHEEADLVWEAVIYPVQEQYRQCSVVGRNMRLEAPGKEGWRAHVLWWLQSQEGMWGRIFSKGDMRSDLHSRKFTSGQPGTEAWWLRGQLRGHCFFTILTVVILGSGCAWNAQSYSTNWFSEPARLFCVLYYVEAGASGIFFSASVSRPCHSFIYKGAPMSFPFSVSWATVLKPRTWVHWNDLLVASGDIMKLVNSSKAKKKVLTWFFFFGTEITFELIKLRT